MKHTISARIDEHIYQSLKQIGAPITDVVHAGLVSFLSMDKEDKVTFIAEHTYLHPQELSFDVEFDFHLYVDSILEQNGVSWMVRQELSDIAKVDLAASLLRKKEAM